MVVLSQILFTSPIHLLLCLTQTTELFLSVLILGSIQLYGTMELPSLIRQELAVLTDLKPVSMNDSAAVKALTDRLQGEIDDLRKAHEEEIRILRFELDEAQVTVAETGDINSQLASDLVDTRGYKDELERMLCDNEEQSQQRIERLERDLGKLARSAEDYELAHIAGAIHMLPGTLDNELPKDQLIITYCT